MNQILLMMGLDSSGLMGGLKKSADAVKGFHKDWKELSHIFGAGGLTYLIIGFFDAMVAGAREAKNNMDSNYEAVRRFGDALDDGKKGATNWGINFLGWLNRAGEAWGGLIAIVKNGIGAFEQGEAGAAAASAVERNLAKANVHAEEFKKITADIKTQTEQTADIRLKQLSVQEQYNVLENELLRLMVQRRNYEGDALGARQLDLQIATQKNKVLLAEVAVNKAIGDETQARYDRDVKREREREDNEAKHQKYLEEHKDIETQISDLEAKAAALRGPATKDAGKQVELDGILTDLDLKRATLAERIAAAAAVARKEAEGQAEAAKMTQQAYESIMFGITNGGHDSRQIQDSTDAALEQLKKQNNDELIRQRTLGRTGPAGGDNLGDALNITRLENENRRIQRELDLRNGIRADVATLGIAGARGNFKGDPLVFDKLVDQFTRTQTATDTTNNLLQDLVQRIGPNGAGNLPATVEDLTTTVQRGFGTLSQQLLAATQRNAVTPGI